MEEYESMTTNEMQRFLDEEAKIGTSEIEAFRKLARILGINFHPLEEAADKNEVTTETENN